MDPKLRKRIQQAIQSDLCQHCRIDEQEFCVQQISKVNDKRRELVIDSFSLYLCQKCLRFWQALSIRYASGPLGHIDDMSVVSEEETLP